MVEHDPWRIFRALDKNMEATAGFNFNHVKRGVHRENSPQASLSSGEGNGIVDSGDL